MSGIDLGNGIHARTTPCKACSAPILWARTAAGATIPLDARAIVFRVEYFRTAPDGTLELLRVAPAANDELIARSFVSHLACCPKASEFSGKRGAEPGATR